MREFSRRTTEALRVGPALRLALPAIEPFLVENVGKEVRKDALVIRRAGEALTAGAPPGDDLTRELLSESRRIDREFLSCIAGFPVRIEIRYEAIEPVRRQRVELGLDTSYRILAGWRSGAALRDLFAPAELEGRVFELLRLYADEIRALSGSVRLPAIFTPLRRSLERTLGEAMTDAARTLARTAAHPPRKRQ